MENEIRYNDETKEILFIGKITSFVFYNYLFNALREHYKVNGIKILPIFSFVLVERFDAVVVPNLIGIGIILKGIHKTKIPLRFARTSSTKFLDNAWFFKGVGKEDYYCETINRGGYATDELEKTGYELFDFDDRFLGFYNNTNEQTVNNPEHKVYIYDDDSYSYYSRFIDPESTPKELRKIRSDKYDHLKPKIEKRYLSILKKIDNEKEKEIIINILTEIITNSILYSGSKSTAMLQTIGKRTIISVSDFGVGFEYSFEKKKEIFGEENREIFNLFTREEQEKYKNYLYIFETLNYSKKRGESDVRSNLYTLLIGILNEVVMGWNNNIVDGTMRIHYNDTQVVFTSNRCRKCEIIDPKKCVKCLLDNRSEDKQKSPVRFFNSKFQGVHIEVELNF